MSEHSITQPAPPRAPGDLGTGAPVPLTSFLGRESDVERLLDLLDAPEVRLLTLTGPGGVGKTRLAQEVTPRAGGSFAHGATFVSLAAVTDPALMASTVARVMDIPVAPGAPAIESLMQALASRHMLLVLDNLEQVAEGVAPVVARILGRCPRITLLATSRVPLRISGEHRYQVAPLGIHGSTAGDEAPGPAMDLFVQRAAAIRPGFALDATNREPVEEICEALDGLPLAIELAAARIRVLSPAAIRSRLDNRLGLLVRTQRNVDPRHHSLRATIAWSYGLLPEPARRLFRFLAVGAEGIGLDATSRLDAGDAGPDPATTLQRLGALVDHHLVQSIDAGDEPRFTMLETIREFAQEALVAEGEEPAAREAHAAHYTSLAARMGEALASRDALGVMPELDREFANIRAAVTWIAAHGRTGDAIALYSGLYTYLLLRGHVEEARDQFEAWLSAPDLDDQARAVAALRSGCLSNYLADRARSAPRIAEATAWFRESGDKRHLAIALVLGFPEPANAGEMEQTAADCREGLALAREVGDWYTAGSAFKHLSFVQLMQGHVVEASSLSEEWLAVAREHGLDIHAGNASMQLGYVRMVQGNLEAALALSSEAERTFRAFDMALSRHYAMMQMGEIALEMGNIAAARTWLERTVQSAREAGTPRTLAPALSTLALLATIEGNNAAALSLVQESIPLQVRLEDDFGIAGCLDLLAAIAAQEGSAQVAATLLGHVDAIYRRVGAERMPGTEVERDVETRQRLVSTLGRDAFTRALEEGASLPPDEVIALATSWRLPTESAPGMPDHRLTPRELEVLRLMCDGLGNAEIGDRLGITARSATAHVTSILTRLDAPNRTACVAWAIRNQVA